MSGFYKVVVEWVFGIELAWNTEVGPGLRIYHGTGLVVHGQARLGRNVALRQGVCIGEAYKGSGVPVLEDDVEVGPGASILGTCTVGTGTRVGAGVVLTRSVPAGSRLAAANFRAKNELADDD